MSFGKADGDAAAVEPDVAPRDEEATFDRLVDEGTQRLGRSWVQLIATGLLGGLDIGVGLLAFLLVKHVTNNELLAGLAFSSGFIALTLAGSELFTENFLVPVVAVVAKSGTFIALIRLWATTLVTNLVAGWLLMALFVLALPDLAETAVQTARKYVDLGVTWHAFALAVVDHDDDPPTAHDGIRRRAVGSRGDCGRAVGDRPRQPRDCGVHRLFCRPCGRRAVRVRRLGRDGRGRDRRELHRRDRPGNRAAVNADAAQGNCRAR